jgi:hypothetical protein
MPNLQNQSLGESGKVLTTGDTNMISSAMIVNGTIVNVDISGTAAIDLSKLASGSSGQVVLANATGVPTYVTVSGDLTASANGNIQISSNTIVNADINSAAAIALTKLASGTSAQIILANSTGVPTYTALSGDVTITNAGVTSLASNITISNNLTVTGDLTVSGNTTTLNTANLNVEDSFILLNSGVTGSPTLDSGLEVERGTSTNVFIRWNETTDKWQFTNDGSTYNDFGAGGASVSDTAPTSPASGQIWFESDTGQTFVYYSDGTSSQWVEIGASGTAAFISDSAPSNPVSGQIWFNSSDGGTYVYYADGSSNQWIEVGAQPQTLNIGDTAPASPVNGQLWYNSSDGGTYVYYGSAWVEVGAAPYNSLLNLIDAKGDLLVGSADNTVVKLGVGSDNQLLMANSSAASGLSWSTIENDQVILAGQIFG